MRTPAARVAIAALALLAAAASPSPARADQDWSFKPYAAFVGGAEYETLQTRAGDDREDRGVTIALSRLGLRGVLAGGVTVESELEVNAGPHGTSVWEGQAALQVRNQLVRFERWGLRVDAGRITDDASLDYYSVHVADQLLTDGYTRGPLLASGYNRGNGVLLRYRIADLGLEPGVTLNAANPTSTTASLVVGGTFPPFSRFYFAPHQQVGRDASKFPADEYHFVLLTPSVIFRRGPLAAQTALQLFRVNTNTSSTADQPIDGYNFRAGLEGRFLGGRLHPFVNFSLVQNECVDPDDGTRLSGEIFTGTTASVGLDWITRGGHGVGAQYAYVRDQQGASTLTTQDFVNLGGTYFLTPTTSLGARVGVYSRCEDLDGTGCEREGERSYFATMRTLF